MKKLLSLIAIVSLCLSLVNCDSNSEKTKEVDTALQGIWGYYEEGINPYTLERYTHYGLLYFQDGKVINTWIAAPNSEHNEVKRGSYSISKEEITISLAIDVYATYQYEDGELSVTLIGPERDLSYPLHRVEGILPSEMEMVNTIAGKIDKTMFK